MGPSEGICGEVFWGVIASVENALWEKGDTIRRNTRDLRVAGLKFSHVEFRALTTRFGEDNPILREILSYAQGGGDLVEFFSVLKSKRGQLPDAPAYDVADLKFVNQSSGTIINEEYIKDTIVDESFEPDGFIINLPVAYETMLDANDNIEYEGAAVSQYAQVAASVKKRYITTQLYVPKANLRRCWRHDNGKLGLSEIGVLVNNVIIMCHRYLADPTNAIAIRMLFRSSF